MAPNESKVSNAHLSRAKSEVITCFPFAKPVKIPHSCQVTDEVYQSPKAEAMAKKKAAAAGGSKRRTTATAAPKGIKATDGIKALDGGDLKQVSSVDTVSLIVISCPFALGKEYIEVVFSCKFIF